MMAGGPSSCRMANVLLLLAAGDLPSDGVASALAKGADEIIAIDGGLRHAVRLGARVSMLIGDLDSIEGLDISGLEVVQLSDQDCSDLAKALAWCKRERDGSEVHVVGLDGGRLDHRMGVAAALVETASDAVVHLEGGNLRRIEEGSVRTLEAFPGLILGLHPMGPVEGVVLRGVKYPLDQANLEVSTLGIHNIAEGDAVEVGLAKGDLLLSCSRC